MRVVRFLQITGKLKSGIRRGTAAKLHSTEQVTSKLKIPGRLNASSVFLWLEQIRTCTKRVRMCALWWTWWDSNP